MGRNFRRNVYALSRISGWWILDSCWFNIDVTACCQGWISFSIMDGFDVTDGEYEMPKSPKSGCSKVHQSTFLSRDISIKIKRVISALSHQSRAMHLLQSNHTLLPGSLHQWVFTRYAALMLCRAGNTSSSSSPALIVEFGTGQFINV